MIWILACTMHAEHEAALAPSLSRLDADQDGRVTADELAPVAPGLDLAVLDTSGDGVLSAAELVAWMDRADPLTFDNRIGRQSVTRQQAAAQERTPPEVRMLMDLFLFLTEELQAAAPDLPRPGEHRLRQAAQTASLSSTESQEVLAALAVGFDDAGLQFPPRLRASLERP